MFLTTLATIFVISTFFLLIRYRAQMAALVAWIIGTIFHSTTKEKEISTTSTNKSPKSKKSKNTTSSSGKKKGPVNVNVHSSQQSKVSKNIKQKFTENSEGKKNKTEAKLETEQFFESTKHIKVKHHVSYEYNEKQIKEERIITKHGKKDSKLTEPKKSEKTLVAEKIDFLKNEINKELKLPNQSQSKQKTEKVNAKAHKEKEIIDKVSEELKSTSDSSKNRQNRASEDNKREYHQKSDFTTKTTKTKIVDKSEITTPQKSEEVNKTVDTNIVSHQAQKENKHIDVNLLKTQKSDKNKFTAIKTTVHSTENKNKSFSDETISHNKDQNEDINKITNVNVKVDKVKKADKSKPDSVNTSPRKIQNIDNITKGDTSKHTETTARTDKDQAENKKRTVIYEDKKQNERENKNIQANLTTQHIQAQTINRISQKNKTEDSKKTVHTDSLGQKIKKEDKNKEVITQKKYLKEEKFSTGEDQNKSSVPKEDLNRVVDTNRPSKKSIIADSRNIQKAEKEEQIQINPILINDNSDLREIILINQKADEDKNKTIDTHFSDENPKEENTFASSVKVQKEAKEKVNETKQKKYLKEDKFSTTIQKEFTAIDTSPSIGEDQNRSSVPEEDQNKVVDTYLPSKNSVIVDSQNIQKEEQIEINPINNNSPDVREIVAISQSAVEDKNKTIDTHFSNKNPKEENTTFASCVKVQKEEKEKLNETNQIQINDTKVSVNIDATVQNSSKVEAFKIEDNILESTNFENKPNQENVENIPIAAEIEIKAVTSTENKIELRATESKITASILEEAADFTVKFDNELPSKLRETETEMPEVTQVRVLTLNDGEHTNSTLYRIQKEWILQFRVGPSLFGRKVSLYCNYPDERDGKSAEFNRNRYFLLPFKQDEGCSNSDDTALYTEINIKIAGSFHYYFVYENATEPCPQGSGYFLVDPVLRFPDEPLPLDCVQCHTVLSKCLGPFSTWESKLRVTRESGYNVVHFTPIQELGKSNSAYSLSGQLKLNPSFDDGNKKTSFTDIENFTNKMRSEWKLLSICDIVLNHTANETDWLVEHPESTYNCLNCPYMRPAYLLDAALHIFSINVKKGVFETEGIPIEICTEDHLNAIRYALHTKVLPEIKLQEMYICNVSKLVSEFLDLARKSPSAVQNRNPERRLKLIRDPLFRRLSAKVDMELALELYNVYRTDSFDEESRLKRCGEEFKHKLDQLNKEIMDQVNDHLNTAIENIIAGIRYFRVQADGPKIVEISLKNPLTSRYFTDYENPISIPEFEEILYGPNSKYLMAHNGWVMNADPMKNFADIDSNVYIRRELIAWGDSVKLRFGDKPEDSPFLWNHMKEYVELTAKIFDGVRLDNCHSTPIPVAEYLLDCARRVRPDLYVVAELFTNSDHTDNIFVNRLGITSLIREAMSAWDSHEEGRLVYRYGGEPVGAFFQPYFRPLVPSIAHALFLDLTHDNPSPVEKRSVFDLLPSSALVNMACCASGSSRGYDELVNHHIHVVDEQRHYTEWTNDESLAKNNAQYVSYKSGIISAKRALNDLHYKLGKENFSQVYVDQVDSDIVTVTRHCPDTHQSVILVAFTAFNHPNTNAEIVQRSIKPLVVEGNLDEIILEASLNHVSMGRGGLKYSSPENFVKDNKWINGLSEYEVDIKQHIQLVNSDVFELGNSNNPNVMQLNFKSFKPGSIVAIKVSLRKDVEVSVLKLRKLLKSFSRKNISDLKTIINHLDLSNLNRAIYRCDQEERDDGKGFGAYSIPNFGPLMYCGLQGFMSLLSNIRPSNDLGHPMCGNLREGNWMIDYIVQRLQINDGTKELGNWMEQNFEYLKNIPRYLIPSYFDVLVTGVYILLLDQCYSLMSKFVKNGSTFVRALALGSVQLTAVINSATLPTFSPNLVPPRPSVINVNGNTIQICDILSAGLPHFSTGYMRSWGRDTFIALRGLFILSGRYQEARYHILGYAACLRHGLIPNLLDGGRNSRFNCRDAVWWWLYCIKCYVEEAPNGLAILSDTVSRIFPTDDSPALEAAVEEQPLYQVMQESLKVHFQGLCFRERNAGRQIDAHMSDNGFNNQIGIHPETGFVFGGNGTNCGTWMDKMGSSDKAGNRGKPATPRDGSAIELIGLSKAVVSWLDVLYEKKQYPYQGVQRASKTGTIISWTFKAWAEKIQNNFERYFWVSINKTQDEIRSDLVNKRGIYKDCYGASQEWTDFQLRCNFPIAMVVAPELFDPKHAWIALQKAEKYLLGPLGMKTLDPEDWTYCGDYNNADDSNNFKTAHGLNYHQGPEWVWPVGFFLRAKLHFAESNGELARTVAKTKVILSRHFMELQTSVWRGLPELTNSNGTYCQDSCRTQAWSMSCILEVLHDLQKIESKQSSVTN